MGQKRLTGDFAPVTVISENRKDDRKRNMIKHVLFDLDGTLLPMDQNEFVKYYMPLLAKRFVKYGMEPKALIGTIWKGVEAMVLNDGSTTNEDAFWKCFEKISGLSKAEVEQETLDFYANEFNEAIASTKPNPRADQVVKLLKEHGVKVYLATNPIFPQNLRYEDWKQAEIELQNLQTLKRNSQAEYEEAQKNLQKWNGDMRKLEGKLEQCHKQLENLGEFFVECEQEKKTRLVEQRADYERILKELQLRLATNQKALLNIEQKSKDIIVLEQKWALVKALSNTANGNISGKEKIMLETYVQMAYFERILQRANVRFMVMSEGQYELARSVVAGNNRSQSGLELDVIDHYNGTRRSVKTLSGGESFKASLSLALGLSDEVQSRAGGIRLDTMFVDEGFGSLDEESLEQAIKALAGLTEGNKLVGIISHVGELKERIDRQIIVTKEKAGGSRAEII